MAVISSDMQIAQDVARTMRSAAKATEMEDFVASSNVGGTNVKVQQDCFECYTSIRLLTNQLCWHCESYSDSIEEAAKALADQDKAATGSWS